MNAPLKSTGSLKALAQQRLEQTSGVHLCRTFDRTFAPKAAHLCSENEGQTCADETALQARCKVACEGLAIQPAELFDALDDDDKNADPSPEALKAFAESLTESRPKALPPNISRAYERLGRTLGENPSMRFTCEALPDEGGDCVLLAVGVRGAGYAVLRMPRKRFDGFRLIEMVARWNNGECPK